jgi:hypothetical protein
VAAGKGNLARGSGADAGERTMFLQQACADDAALRQLVEALLVSDRNIGDFLAEPAIHLVGAREIEVEGTHEPAAPDSPELQQLGSYELGSYDVLHEIGRGGMGIVYAARDRRLGRTLL